MYFSIVDNTFINIGSMFLSRYPCRQSDAFQLVANNGSLLLYICFIFISCLIFWSLFLLCVGWIFLGFSEKIFSPIFSLCSWKHDWELLRQRVLNTTILWPYTCFNSITFFSFIPTTTKSFTKSPNYSMVSIAAYQNQEFLINLVVSRFILSLFWFG